MRKPFRVKAKVAKLKAKAPDPLRTENSLLKPADSMALSILKAATRSSCGVITPKKYPEVKNEEKKKGSVSHSEKGCRLFHAPKRF